MENRDDFDDFFDGINDEPEQEEPTARETITRDDVNNMIGQLIDRAEANVHAPIEPIRTLSVYLAADTLLTATKRVYRDFGRSAKNILRAYKLSLDIEPIKSNLEMILMYACMKHCEEFYKIEYKNLDKAMSDGLKYAFSGHFMDFFMN